MGLALLIFLVAYILILSEKINRALIVCSGGLLMVLLGVVHVRAMITEYIDWETLALLISMMVIVAVTSRTGVFAYIAIAVAQKTGGRPLLLLTVFSGLTALGSALLDNVTTVLLFVPIVLKITEILEVHITPYFISMILFSNIGGMATLIGDPPNIMIGQQVAHLGFNDFLAHMTPAVVMIYIAVLGCILWFWRRSLYVTEANRRKLFALRPAAYLGQHTVLIKALFVLSLTIIGFIAQPIHHVDVAIIATAGALLLILLTYRDYQVTAVFRSIEWTTLFFFIGLFMLVGGLRATGWIDHVAEGIMSMTNGDLKVTSLMILWGSGLMSGFVDNIPFVAAMIPVIEQFHEYGMGNVTPLWWSLALGASLGGNATLVGASANVIVAGMANKSGHPISFVRFLKVGIPIVVLSLVISTFYLYFRYWIHFD